MKVYLARDWRGIHIFVDPPILIKCGGMPDIWSGHRLPVIPSVDIDDIPRGEYVEMQFWWSIVKVCK